MHPKVMFLALHGFALFVTEINGYRIKRNLATSEDMLYFDHDRWHIGNANKPAYYTELHWDQLPQGMLDKLRQDLIDDLIGE